MGKNKSRKKKQRNQVNHTARDTDVIGNGTIPLKVEPPPDAETPSGPTVDETGRNGIKVERSGSPRGISRHGESKEFDVAAWDPVSPRPRSLSQNAFEEVPDGDAGPKPEILGKKPLENKQEQVKDEWKQEKVELLKAPILSEAALEAEAFISENPEERLRTDSEDAGILPDDDFIRYYVKGENPETANDWNSSVSFFDFIWQDLGMEDEEDQAFSAKNASVEDDVLNFIRVPLEVEKLLFFGFFMCLDSLLFILVFLPLRIVRALVLLVATAVIPLSFNKRMRFHRTQFYDLLRGAIIFMSFLVVMRAPMSRIYHYVRGQTFIKLYVIFNMLDIFDRLMCSFGQDILDSLFYITKTSPRAYGRIFYRLVIGIIYAVLHTLLYFVRLITLNVAINSSSNALMTILISNNFVELKGSVFKRFAEQNLFQITCSDIVERFELFLFLLLTATQHIDSWYDYVQGSAMYVFSCELLVDWIKHAFITKFNRIKYTSYGNFLEALCRDVAPVGNRKQPYASSQRLGGRPVDQTQAVAQRIGLATLPLTCIVLRFMWANCPAFIYEEPLAAPTIAFVLLSFSCLVLLKSFLNLMLRGHACKVLMSRERKILHSSSPTLSNPPSTPKEKELQKAAVARHMQKIDQLAGIRRYQIYKSRVPT